MQAYSADSIFTGSEWLKGHVLVVQNGYIADVIPAGKFSDADVKHFPNCFITPSFIDIQIYGAHGSLLAVEPTAETLGKMYDYCVSGGANYFLPTIATNTTQVFHDCIRAVKEYWKKGGKGVIGLHIEGPWINKEKRGAHVESLIHAPTLEEVKALLKVGDGVIKMMTLAPEICDNNVVDLIQSHGVIVSAGHSNASYQQAIEAFDNGITVATHLFNAMSPLQHREPGLAGAIMHHSSAMSSIIPDGFHVDFAALSIAKKAMGERLFMITDAVTETDEGYYPHQMDGDKYVSNGILSGSALTMMKGVRNCVTKAGIHLDEALRMASLYPAKVLGLENETGKLERGFKAGFVVITNELEIA